jgi:hypothetical protein
LGVSELSDFVRDAVCPWRTCMDPRLLNFRPSPITLDMAPVAPTPTFESPAVQRSPIQLHRTRELLVEHVERHFALPEALLALSMAEPAVAEREAFRSGRAMIRALRATDGDPHWDDLLAGYADCARRTLDRAAAEGWVVAPAPHVRIAFSPTGLLAVVDRGVLRTMFFPGLEADEDRALRLGLGAAELAAERARESRWSPLERHYYRVFRPALQRVRSLPDDGSAGLVAQYGALKRALPSAPALDLARWIERLMRARMDEGGDR